MDILSFVEKIEQQYNVNSVRYKNAQLWPYFRIYLAHNKIGSQKITTTKKVVFTALKNTFYGFKNYFSKVDYIVFSNKEQRKLIDGKYYDRLDFLPKKYKKNLFFELTQDSFYKLNEIPTKNIVSKIPLYVLAKIFEYFVSLQTVKNKEVFESIVKESELSLNADLFIKNYIAQYKVAQLIIKIYKPKALILITSYTNYAYIQAFKDAGLKVIEFQHGLINNKHLAYNFKLKSDKRLFPNYLLTFGSFEKEIFDSKNNFINNDNIFPIGHFYFDYLKNSFIKDNKLQNKLQNYKKSIAITLQYQWEEKMIDFIEEVASIKNDIAFVIIPRHRKDFVFNNKNVFMYNSINCYQVLLNCDIHSTIYSSCATESLGLNKPNILVNIDNQSQEHLEFLLSDSSSRAVNTIDEFIEMVDTMDFTNATEMVNNRFFISNFADNLELVLNDVLK